MENSTSDGMSPVWRTQCSAGSTTTTSGQLPIRNAPFWGYIANRRAAFSETNEASVGQSIRRAAMPWVNSRGRVAAISEKPGIASPELFARQFLGECEAAVVGAQHVEDTGVDPLPHIPQVCESRTGGLTFPNAPICHGKSGIR